MLQHAQRTPVFDLDAERLSSNDKMALARTALAFERTFMAWVRTATSLITFGFGIVKAGDYLKAEGKQAQQWFLGAHEFGFSLIGIGVFVLAGAVIQRTRLRHALRELHHPLPIFSLGFVVALLFAVLGVLALIEFAGRL
jgi:putative membrane protein